jgi:hypothetical protein
MRASAVARSARSVHGSSARTLSGKKNIEDNWPIQDHQPSARSAANWPNQHIDLYYYCENMH